MVNGLFLDGFSHIHTGLGLCCQWFVVYSVIYHLSIYIYSFPKCVTMVLLWSCIILLVLMKLCLFNTFLTVILEMSESNSNEHMCSFLHDQLKISIVPNHFVSGDSLAHLLWVDYVMLQIFRESFLFNQSSLSFILDTLVCYKLFFNVFQIRLWYKQWPYLFLLYLESVYIIMPSK